MCLAVRVRSRLRCSIEAERARHWCDTATTSLESRGCIGGIGLPFAEPHERPSPILTVACLSLIPILLAAMLVMILVIADAGDEAGGHLEQLIDVLERWR